MSERFPHPRKQRTRQHVIADQGVHYLVRFILDEGHTAQHVDRDYGYDLFMFTYDEHGYAEPGYVAFQVKATDTLNAIGDAVVFDTDIRDYNLWMLEKSPVVLVLFDASRKRAYWQAIQLYFRQDPRRQPRKGVRSVRVHVPISQKVNRRAIARLRDLKRVADLTLLGGQS